MKIEKLENGYLLIYHVARKAPAHYDDWVETKRAAFEDIDSLIEFIRKQLNKLE